MYLLEDMVDRGVGSECYILCTQPRRIAAISIAARCVYVGGVYMCVHVLRVCSECVCAVFTCVYGIYVLCL